VRPPGRTGRVGSNSCVGGRARCSRRRQFDFASTGYGARDGKPWAARVVMAILASRRPRPFLRLRNVLKVSSTFTPPPPRVHQPETWASRRTPLEARPRRTARSTRCTISSSRSHARTTRPSAGGTCPRPSCASRSGDDARCSVVDRPVDRPHRSLSVGGHRDRRRLAADEARSSRYDAAGLDNVHRFMAGIYLATGLICFWAAYTIRQQGLASSCSRSARSSVAAAGSCRSRRSGCPNHAARGSAI